MQNIPNFTPEFNRIARKHGFKMANKTAKRIKDLISNAKTPLGEKNTNVVYDASVKNMDIPGNGPKMGKQERRTPGQSKFNDTRSGKWGHITY